MFRKLVTALSLVTLLTGSVAVVEAGWDEGVAAFKAGNYAQAAKEFQGVVEQQPDVYQGHLMLGQALLKLNRDQEALTHLRKAFELDPSEQRAGSAYPRQGLSRSWAPCRRRSHSGQDQRLLAALESAGGSASDVGHRVREER